MGPMSDVRLEFIYFMIDISFIHTKFDGDEVMNCFWLMKCKYCIYDEKEFVIRYDNGRYYFFQISMH